MPKRRMTGDERREAVLAIAIAEFARTGLHGTSTEKIAAGAGISHPYLFRLYRTKKALFLACLERCHERLHETFTRAAEVAGDGDRLEAMGKAYVDLLADREMLLLQLQGYAACDDPEVRRVASGGYAELWEIVGRVSGAPEEEVRAFFATGMLLNVAAAMDLPQIAGEPGWALAHLRASARASAAATADANAAAS
jgi:AcrR family transcriptional regulator